MQHIITLLMAVALAAPAEFSSARVADVAPKLAIEELMIGAADPGTRLYVRNKRPQQMMRFASDKALSLVHGAHIQQRGK
jgi:hypothetical protein